MTKKFQSQNVRNKKKKTMFYRNNNGSFKNPI